MNKLTAQLLPQVINIINEYGILVDVYRNIYENDEFGIKQLVQENVLVASLKVVIDNSKDSQRINNRFKVEGLIRPLGTSVMYYAYDANINLQREDFILIDGIKYILDIPQNILHYDIIYQVNLEATTDEH